MSTDFSYTEAGDGVYEVPLRPMGQCTGRQNLLQRIMLLLLTDTSDPLRYQGGNLYATLSSSNLTGSDLDRIKNLLKIALAETAETVRGIQAAQTGLPDDEKLSSLELGDVALVGDDGLDVTVQIVSVSGESTAATLNLEI